MRSRRHFESFNSVVVVSVIMIVLVWGIDVVVILILSVGVGVGVGVGFVGPRHLGTFPLSTIITKWHIE